MTHSNTSQILYGNALEPTLEGTEIMLSCVFRGCYKSPVDIILSPGF